MPNELNTVSQGNPLDFPGFRLEWRDCTHAIGATNGQGKPYANAHGVSVSADGRRFRFWKEEVFFPDDHTMELYRPPPETSTWREGDGKQFYNALVAARDSGIFIYVAINLRGRPDKNGKSRAMKAAPVLTLAGTPAPGRVLFVDPESGEARLKVSLSASSEDPSFFLDQFDVLESLVSRTESRSSRFTRDPAVRRRVLDRAGGICERPSCREPGFETLKGILYLETHHVIPLGDGGLDSTNNVVALCPDCHAKAHYWIDRDSIRKELLEWLSRIHSG